MNAASREIAFPDPRDVLGAIRLTLLLRALADDATLLETISALLDRAEPTPESATQPTHLLVDAVAVQNDRRRAERAQGESAQHHHHRDLASRKGPAAVMADRKEERLYLATITVDILLYVEDPPPQIGGKDVTCDEHAAWDALAALSLLETDEAQGRMDEGGYEYVIAQKGVTRLRRVKPDKDVETDWYKTKAGRSR